MTPSHRIPNSTLATRVGAALLVGAGAVLAWSQRGVHEDGFFILRMVEVFLQTGELAYNPGERYEPNTDFLWTLLLIPGPALGIDLIQWMWLVSMAAYAATLLATYALACRLLPSPAHALIPLALLATHFSFAFFAAVGYGIALLALAGVCALLALWRFGRTPLAAHGWGARWPSWRCAVWTPQCSACLWWPAPFGSRAAKGGVP